MEVGYERKKGGRSSSAKLERCREGHRRKGGAVGSEAKGELKSEQGEEWGKRTGSSPSRSKKESFFVVEGGG